MVLLDVVDEDFESSIYASKVEVNTESPNFNRLSTALVLSGIDAGRKRVEDLVVAVE